jgi:alpha-L-fucosidase 2
MPRWSKGREALRFLLAFLNNEIINGPTVFSSRLHTNTFTTETEGRNPTMETPLCAANALIELLLQSHGGKIRVFPAVPVEWACAEFQSLREQGAFLVSAIRINGRTARVDVQSLAGEPLLLKISGWTGIPRQSGVRVVDMLEIAPGEYRVDLKKGETLSLFQGEQRSPFGSLPGTAEPRNPFGLKKRAG